MTEPRPNPIVACLAGDGIGPEVMAEAGRVIEAVSSLMGARVRQVHLPFGGDAIDKHQHPFPAHVRAAVRASDAVLLGAVGGPAVGVGAAPARGRAARAAQGARHVRQPAARAPRGHRPDRRARADRRALLRREGARPTTMRSTRAATRASRSSGWRGGRSGSRSAARGVLSRWTRHNVLATSKLWRQVVTELHAAEAPELQLTHELVDSFAMNLATRPDRYDVILTENLFGDILSDLAAAVGGGLGLAPSASLGADGARDLRAGARLGARHRRPGRGEPDRDDPLGRR